MSTVILHSYKPVNPGGESLSAEKLRTFPGFEGCSEDEAANIVEHIKTLAGILVRSVNKPLPSKQGQTIDLEPGLKAKKAA